MAIKEKGFWAGIGAVATAILASTCCWLPLLLLALGAGAAATSIAGFVENFRPLVGVLAIGLLGTAAYFTYVHKAPEECCAVEGRPPQVSKIKRFNRYFLPVVAVLVLAFTLFPNQILTALAPRKVETVRAQASDRIVTLKVPGMTWPVSWPDRVKRALEGVEGVRSVAVDFESRTARVALEKPVPAEKLLEALRKAGYPSATPEP